MATTLKPFGLSEVGYLLGAKPRGSTIQIPVNSGTGETFASGDPVTLLNGQASYLVPQTATQPSAQNQVTLGVFQSCFYQPTQTGSPPQSYPVWIGGTLCQGQGSFSVNSDPFVIYNIQANGSLTATAIGCNANLGGAGNSSTAQGSGVYLDATTVNSSPWLAVKIIGLAPITPNLQVQGGNSWGDPYTIVQVVLNNTVFKAGTYGGVL